jgi:hypothetical protein
MAEQKSQAAMLQDLTLLALVQAEEASQHAGGPVVLPTAADLEQE